MRSIIKGRKNEQSEEKIEEVKFKVHKFTPRLKPKDRRNVIVFSCFSEFGTEILGSVYCIPSLLAKHPGKYSIIMGWKGRAFLYKHLVDEFWEIDEQHMWLRKYCRAFHHYSVNLSKLEEQARKTGTLIDPLTMGSEAVYPVVSKCLRCGKSVRRTKRGQVCRGCKFIYNHPGFFERMEESKKLAVWPVISQEKKEAMGKYLKPNSIGITARNRAAYGRNLPPIFYERLIYQLEDMGYNPIWLGEKTSTHPCPFERIFDFTSMSESDDLECTLGLVSHLKFTIQFWTASTRLAGLVDTPYILFESPDQIYGGAGSPGHEGFRLKLCTKGDKGKLVLCHYNDIASSHDTALDLVKQAVRGVEEGDYGEILGMVDNEYWSRRIWKA